MNSPRVLFPPRCVAAALVPVLGARAVCAQAAGGRAGRLLSATPAIADMRARSAGIGLAAGGAGAEVLRRLTWYAGVGAGVGVAGVGARAFVLPGEAIDRWGVWRPAVAVEVLAAPWRWGELHARAAVGYSVGLQRWGSERDRYAEIGLGVAHLVGGTWFGRRGVPMLRVGIGQGRPF